MVERMKQLLATSDSWAVTIALSSTVFWSIRAPAERD
jgi:hypothetical protein